MSKTEKLETVSSFKIKEYGSYSEKIMLRSRQKGSILIGIIITMVVMASLGAGMVYLTTTSTFQELFANNHSRAYYSAESGGRYAMAVIRKAFASSNYTTDADYTALKANSVANPVASYTFGGNTFKVQNIVVSGTTTKQVDFDVIGIVNASSFLQAQRKLSYRIIPADQTGNVIPGSLPLQTLIPLTPGNLDPIAGTEYSTELVDGRNGIMVQGQNPGGGSNTKSAIIVPTASLGLTGNYNVQLKVAGGEANRWNIGMMFNVDSSKVANMTPDGYGLTYVYLTDNAELKREPVNSIIPKDPSGAILTTGPMLLLWQSVTSGSVQNYKWIAYKVLDVNSSLPGSLTSVGLGPGTRTDGSNDAPTIVVSIQRTSSDNTIRAYYASPSNVSLITPPTTPPSDQATDDKRFGYNLWSVPVGASEIKWPDATASWTRANDYFTLVQWDAINTLGTGAASSGTGLEAGAVITSTVLNGSLNKELALYLNQSSKPSGYFFDFAVSVPSAGSGTPVDGSGAVVQY
jgi:hypothetical protein